MTDEPRGAFGDRLAMLLDERDMTPTDLGRRIDHMTGRRNSAMTTACRWANGTVEPGYTSLKRIHKVLGCTWEELMGD